MKKLILLLLLTLTLFAQNPKIFSALGDVIYDDVAIFKKIKNYPSMHKYRKDIDAYIISAKKTKKIGLAIDAKEEGVDSKSYLKMLRELSKKHDGITVHINQCFKDAMAAEDSESINTLIIDGVIDPKDYKNELITYYEEYGEDDNLSSLSDMYAEHLKSMNLKKHVNVSQSEEEARENAKRIERMRAKTMQKEEALNQSVLEEKNREKQKVLSAQKKELGI